MYKILCIKQINFSLNLHMYNITYNLIQYCSKTLVTIRRTSYVAIPSSYCINNNILLGRVCIHFYVGDIVYTM